MAPVTNETISKWRNQADAALASNDLDLAESLYLDIIEASFENEEEQDLLRDCYNHAGILVRQQKFEPAEAHLKELLPELRNRPRPSNEEIAGYFLQQEEGAKQLLIEALKGQGKDYEHV